MKDHELQSAMWQALHSPLGVRCRTSDIDTARRRFYALRKTQPEFAQLSTALPPDAEPSILWIVNNKPQETPDASQED